MGDAMAPEFAQASHLAFLRRCCGAMRFESVVGARRLFPRGPLWELLTYDDHATLLVVQRGRAGSGRPDLSIFGAADREYPKVGLHQHPKKRVRDATSGVVLGTYVDGLRGVVHAPTHRILVLQRITLEVSRLGAIDGRSLMVVVHSWVHIFMYRRCLLSIFDHTFRWCAQVDLDRVCRLPGAVKNEL
eukprot:794942-Amphidinium_carterae.1